MLAFVNYDMGNLGLLANVLRKVCSGRMARAQALELVAASPCPDERQMAEDRAFFLMKLGFAEEEFRQYLSAPGVSHGTHPSEQALWNFCRDRYGKLKRKGGA